MRERPSDLMTPVPGIRVANFDLESGKLVVAGCVDEIDVPHLFIGGDANQAISGGYRDGELTVCHQSKGSQTNTFSADGKYSISIGHEARPIAAALMLPSGYQLDQYNIAMTRGKVHFQKVHALGVAVASITGEVIIDGMVVRNPRFNTISGNIDLMNLHTADPAILSTVSGKISVIGGRADYWQIGNTSGRVIAGGGVRGEFVSPAGAPYRPNIC